MKEYFGEAKEELKRADHLIYVSLKYTRSVDVIRSVIGRLINAFEILVKGMLDDAKERKKVSVVPASPGMQADILRDLYGSDPEIVNYMHFYLLLRKMYQGKFSSSHEFRRNVTMTVTVDNKLLEVNIDIITEYYKRSLQFLEYLKEKHGK